MKSYHEKQKNVIMNFADDKGLTEGMASISRLDYVVGLERSKVSNNKKRIYFDFSDDHRTFSCVIVGQILSPSSFISHVNV